MQDFLENIERMPESAGDRRDFLKYLGGGLAGAFFVSSSYADEKPAKKLYERDGQIYRPVKVLMTAYTRESGPLTKCQIKVEEASTIAADTSFHHIGTPVYIPLIDADSPQFGKLPRRLQNYANSSKWRRHIFNGQGFVADTGEKIKGPDHIDIPILDKEMAILWGRQHGMAYFGISEKELKRLEKKFDVQILDWRNEA